MKQAGIAAREAVNLLDLATDIDPMDALLEELARTNGVVAWLGQKVSTLMEEKELANAKVVSEIVGPVGGASGGIPEYKPSVWYTMWAEEREHLGKVAKLCLDAGIDKRRVEIAEQQGQLLAKVVNVILSKLGIDIESPKTRAAVRAGFTEVLPSRGELEAVAANG